ncbi:MAG TPA: oligosaccharyl transferase, archaeosortase A system-associated [Dehalococcoidia bacterium]|nr:oligosaccharyl transferase, archaeosortase A system-associated [Dehalococcoidia bacterium]
MSIVTIEKKLSDNATSILALTLIFGIALFLRIYFPYDNVFVGDWIKFQWDDSWYHMRLVENLVYHFPHRIHFDPYSFYPHGQDVFYAPFFDLLLGFFAWLFGAGSPSTKVIETVGAYFPAILGSLVTIPVYFIGKELFNKKVGLLAAALITILPGQFLLRSLLGFTDHHVAETLLSTLTVLFLILATKRAIQKDCSFNSVRSRDWAALRKPLIYSLLAGISLGFYLLSWVGGAFLVFAILVFFVIQYIIDHLKGRATDYLCITGIPVFLIALLMVAPFSGLIGYGKIHIAALFICALAFPVLSILSTIMIKIDTRRIYYPLVVVAVGGIGYALFYAIDKSLVNSILEKLNVLWPSETAITIGEVMPLSVSIVWEEFTTCFYLAMIALVIIAYLVIKEGASDKTLLFIWSVIMLMATIGQNRFAYYFAVNVALLAGYLSWRILALVITGIRTYTASEVARVDMSQQLKKVKGKAKSRKKGKRKKEKAQKTGLRTLVTRFPLARYTLITIAILSLFFLAFYPNIGSAILIASSKSQPAQDWHDALVWMRDNTPDPFLDPDFFYDLYDSPPKREDYSYPESAYGVMSWWDYGHWITYIAHRIPNANPHQSGAAEAAKFFTAQDESSANQMLNELGSKYIIIDVKTPLHEIDPKAGTHGHFHAVVQWAEKDRREFYEQYFVENESGGLTRVTLYYPAFYQSMSSRLYIFGCEEWIPNNCSLVISYIEKRDKKGIKYKEVTDQQRFPTYEEAISYLGNQTDPNYRIVGNNPLNSPVPLERLEHYKLIYKSPFISVDQEDRTISAVEIFEYTP